MADASLIERLEAECARQRECGGDALTYGKPDPLLSECLAAIRSAEAEIKASHRIADDVHAALAEADRKNEALLAEWNAAETEAAALRERVVEAEHCMGRAIIALHDAISRPMGVVPDSADEFYRPEGRS